MKNQALAIHVCSKYLEFSATMGIAFRKRPMELPYCAAPWMESREEMRCYHPLQRTRKNILKGKTCRNQAENSEKNPFLCSILDFPGCKSVTVRFSNLMIYRSVSSRCHPSWTFFVLPDSGWHLLPSLAIGGVLQVCTGRGQVSREKKSFDHEQMNRDEALNSSNTTDARDSHLNSLGSTACTLQKYQQKSNNQIFWSVLAGHKKKQLLEIPSRILLKRSRMMTVFLRSPWMICEGGLLNQV